MKRVALVLALLVAGVARAEPEGRIPHGLEANAGFAYDDGICTQASVSVRVLYGRWGAPPAQPPHFRYLELEVRGFDYCTGTDIDVLFVSSPTSDFTFEYSASLESAHLVASFPVICSGTYCPEANPVATIDLTWTATSGFARGGFEQTHYRYKDAVVTGTVQLGDLLLTPTHTGAGRLTWVHSDQIL